MKSSRIREILFACSLPQCDNTWKDFLPIRCHRRKSCRKSSLLGECCDNSPKQASITSLTNLYKNGRLFVRNGVSLKCKSALHGCLSPELSFSDVVAIPNPGQFIKHLHWGQKTFTTVIWTTFLKVIPLCYLLSGTGSTEFYPGRSQENIYKRNCCVRSILSEKQIHN